MPEIVKVDERKHEAVEFVNRMTCENYRYQSAIMEFKKNMLSVVQKNVDNFEIIFRNFWIHIFSKEKLEVSDLIKSFHKMTDYFGISRLTGKYILLDLSRIMENINSSD